MCRQECNRCHVWRLGRGTEIRAGDKVKAGMRVDCADLLANAVMGSPIPMMPYKVLGLLENSKVT